MNQRNHTEDELDKVMNEIISPPPTSETNEKADRLVPVPIGQILATDYPEQPWLINGLIPLQTITILSGDPGSFKTWLTIEMAKCVATGTDFLGKFPTQQGAVLMVDEENIPRHLQKRFKLLGVPATVPIHYITQAGVKIEADVEQLVEAAKECSVKLVIIDSFVRIHSEDENESKVSARIFGLLREFTKAGMSLLLTHHHRKQQLESRNSSYSLRGSSDILAAIDCHLVVRREESELTVSQNKLRVDEALKPFKVAIVNPDADTLRLEYAGEVKEKQAQKDKAKEVIVAVLQEGSQLTRQEVDARVREVENIGAGAIGEALKELGEEETLIVTKGAKGKKIYSLPPNEDQSQPAF